MTRPLTSVTVRRFPFGITSFVDASADLFDEDILTITYNDVELHNEHGPWKVFEPGTWRSATVYDANGHIDYTVESGAERGERAATIAKINEQRNAEATVHGGER